MPKPVVPNHYPPGLESLNQIDQILIHQQTEVIESKRLLIKYNLIELTLTIDCDKVLIGFETTNKYVIKNSLGQKIFFAAEESGCCARYCCGNLRHFEMNILDNSGNEVIHISRPLACQSCLYPCCLQVDNATLHFHVLLINKFCFFNERRKWKCRHHQAPPSVLSNKIGRFIQRLRSKMHPERLYSN